MAVRSSLKVFAVAVLVFLGSAAFAQADLSRTLVLAVDGSPPTFDPLLAGSDSRVNTPSINVYNALFQFVPGTSNVVPELAEAMEVSDDGLSVTFVIRSGVLFHDGSEVHASDVAYTAMRMLALQVGTARNFGALEGVEEVDERTVRFALKYPFPSLPLALPRLYILNADLVRANERDGDWGQQWLQSNSAGSGPFTLTSFQPEQQYTLDRFDGYYGGFPVNAPEQVIVRTIREEATRRLALERGDVDWIRVGSTDTFAALEGMEGIQRFVSPTLNQLYIAMNVDSVHLQDPRIREALTLAYDYEGHVEIVRSGFGEIARGPLPQAIACFDDAIPYSSFDLDRARALMAEAGFPNGGFTLEMAYQGTSPEETAAFQIMQSGAAGLGITIRPIPVEWPAKVELFSTASSAPALGTVWEYPAYPDPDIFLYGKLHSSRANGGGFNFANFVDPRVDALLEEARIEPDLARRCELYVELQHAWLTASPYVNISVGTELSAARSWVENYTYTASHAFTINAYTIRIVGKE